MKRALSGMSVVLFIVLGCGGSQPNLKGDALVGDPVLERTQESRDRQLKKLWEFDNFVKQGEAHCNDMCTLHTQICTLSTEICGDGAANKSHKRIMSVCEAATKTCRNTNLRLPEGCWCQ